MMQKRGQVTAFVIVGIVIILIIGLLFFMKDYYGVGVDPKVHIQGPLNSIKDEVSELIKEIKSSKKASDFDEILIPGERALNLMKENLMKGYLEIDDKIVEDIKNLL